MAYETHDSGRDPRSWPDSCWTCKSTAREGYVDPATGREAPFCKARMWFWPKAGFQRVLCLVRGVPGPNVHWYQRCPAFS